MERKKRVGLISSHIGLKTGFSANLRRVLNYLYPLDKYELYVLAQGIPENHPDLNRYPWKTFPALVNSQIDHQRYQNPNEEAYRREISYGNAAVYDFVVKNQLDVLFHIEDIWSSSFEKFCQSKWWPLLKSNFVNWSTADSLPVLNNFKQFAEVGKVWFWSSFARKALLEENRAKYEANTDVVPGCIDPKEYTPLLRAEKEELRKQFGIDPNTTIFMQLGRNQLRKLFPVTLECFAKFKKQNPGANAKLLFHTSWAEGWNLPQQMEYWKVKKEDVLTTHFCENCGKWEIKPFNGEKVYCRFCNNPNSQITAGITSTISNEDISKIYNLATAVVSPFTSGGLEYTNLEALLCEIPLASSDYSSGEDFTVNDFVFSLTGEKSYEIGTGFLKHNPNRSNFVKIMEKIHNMSYEDRKKMGQRGRKWVIENYSTEKICQKVMDFVDNANFVDWSNFNTESEQLKNPNIPVENLEKDEDFIKQLYSKILNMTVNDQDTGLNHWTSALKNGMSRQEVVNFFNKTALEENQKILSSKKKDFSELLDNTGRKRFLITAKESYGDLFYSTCLLKSFREVYPDHDIYFATDQQYFEVFEGNENIYKLLPWMPQLDSEISMIGQGSNKGFFDGYCNLFAPTQKFLNYLGNNNINLTLNY